MANKESRRSFAIGFAMKEYVTNLSDKKKISKRASLSRAKKFGAMRVVIEEILRSEPNVPARSVIQRLSRGNKYIEKLIDKIEEVSGKIINFSILDVDF